MAWQGRDNPPPAPCPVKLQLPLPEKAVELEPADEATSSKVTMSFVLRLDAFAPGGAAPGKAAWCLWLVFLYPQAHCVGVRAGGPAARLCARQ